MINSPSQNCYRKNISSLIASISFCWLGFQIFIESPEQFDIILWLKSTWLGNYIEFTPIGSVESRAIHLGFAIFLCFLLCPTQNFFSKKYVLYLDSILAITGVFCAFYIFIFSDGLANRVGAFTTQDTFVASLGTIILLEACRRFFSWPLLIIIVIFLLYGLFGHYDFVPPTFQHYEISLSKLVHHLWFGYEGVFGVFLGTSSNNIFLLILLFTLLYKMIFRDLFKCFLEHNDQKHSVIKILILQICLVMPAVLIIWFSYVEKKSLSLSTYYAFLVMILVFTIQSIGKALFERKCGGCLESLKSDILKFKDGVVLGTKLSAIAAICLAGFGIIVGIASLANITFILQLVISLWL